MTPSAGEYAGRARDSRWERDLAKQLRRAPESERLAFIRDLAASNPGVACDLAKRCLTDKRSLVALLDYALDHADASGVRYWLESIVPRLGYRRVVSHLRKRTPTHAQGVDKAAYWLPLFSGVPGFNRYAIKSLRLPVDFAGFLDDPDLYARAEGHWVALWEVVEDRSRFGWVQPWFERSLPDGNPIFSAVSRQLRRGIRIIQHEPTATGAGIVAYLDVFGGPPDDPESIRELVVSCAWSDTTSREVLALVRPWVANQAVTFPADSPGAGG